MIRRIQVARKNAGLNLDDRIRLEIACAGELRDVLEMHRERVMGETLATALELVEKPSGKYTEDSDVDGDPLGIGISW